MLQIYWESTVAREIFGKYSNQVFFIQGTFVSFEFDEFDNKIEWDSDAGRSLWILHRDSENACFVFLIKTLLVMLNSWLCYALCFYDSKIIYRLQNVHVR